MLAAFLFLRYWGATLVLQMIDVMRGSLQNLNQPELTVETVMNAVQTFSLLMAVAVLPVFLLMMGIGLASNFLQVGFLIIGRAAPQMNIFFVGQPVKIGVGLVVFFLALPVMVATMGEVFRGITVDLNGLMQAHG